MKEGIIIATLIAALSQAANNCNAQRQLEPVKVEEVTLNPIKNLEERLKEFNLTQAYVFNNNEMDIIVDGKAQAYEVIINYRTADFTGTTTSERKRIGEAIKGMDLEHVVTNIQINLYNNTAIVGSYSIPLYFVGKGRLLIINEYGIVRGINWETFGVKDAKKHELDQDQFWSYYKDIIYEVYNSKTRKIYGRFDIDTIFDMFMVPFHPEADAMRILHKNKVVGRIENLRLYDKNMFLSIQQLLKSYYRE